MSEIFMQPQNGPIKYEQLFLEIDNGQIKLPRFQRDFVWDKAQTAKLIDSIIKGFPIGTFILWRTKEELKSYRDIGNHPLKAVPQGDYASYILDGQQRITSLYAVKKGLRIDREGKSIDYKDIYLDLNLDTESDEQIVLAERPDDDGEETKFYISVHDVLNKDSIDLEDDYSKQHRKLIQRYKTTLTGYDFSTIVIKDYPIEIACEVFERINTGGKSLTLFEIMVAKTYDEQRKFDLYEEFLLLRDGSDTNSKSLRGAKFDTIGHSVFLQSVAAIAIRQVRARDILKMKRSTFIDHWNPMKESLFEAVDFVRHTLRVQVSQLLPYDSMLVPITYFFYQTANKKPNAFQRKMLEQWFYWAGLNYRFNSGTESKLADDLSKMEKIINNIAPAYPSNELTIDQNDLKEWTFSAGDAGCKSVLCALAFHQPKSFDSNAIVNLDNSNLRIATSKNYHHFFPKAYLGRVDPNAEPNLMANITLIDGYGNKHRIGKKPPSEYISIFSKENADIEEALNSHLIGDIEKFGITTDDYEKFISSRTNRIAKVLHKKLNP